MKAAMETRLPVETVDAFLKDRGWAWDPLMRGEYGVTIDQVELAIVAADPVLFAECFLKNPQTIPDSDIVAGEPLRLLPYQQESIRYRGDIITQDGSEVGKTLEIVVLILSTAMTVPRAKILVGAPEYVHILEIIDAIEEQRSMSELVESSIKYERKAPHYVYRSSIGALVYFIPAGHEGTAFRGKHVNSLAIFDEAAKAKNPKIISEFFRARMPGCRTRIYSVPDGDRTTEYFRLKDEARKSGDGASLDDFRFFHRPKTLQPPPFWTPEREREMTKKYGGRHTPGYVHNVLGEDGEPENPIFPYTQFIRMVADIPEYRLVSIDVSPSDETLRLEVSKITASATRAEDAPKKQSGDLSAQTHIVADEVYPMAEINTKGGTLAALVSRHLPEAAGLMFGGCDPGKVNDPAEVMIFRAHGSSWRLVLRVAMRGLGYDLQEEVLAALVAKLGLKSLGVDMGGVGSALVDGLTSVRHQDDHLDEIISGLLFNEKIDAVNEDGEPIIDPKTETPVRKTLLQTFVETLTGKAQRVEMQFPYDMEIINSFTSFTAREGQNGNLIFSKKDDHIVHAVVQAAAARILKLETAVSAFVGGAFNR